MEKIDGEIKRKQNLLKELLKKKNAILLAHNYQRDEIQEIADFQGDSLELSIKANQTNADIIVFCGVRFMAESAAIMNPDKKVILPAEDAGCPMVDMITVKDILNMKAEFPDAAVVAYVNTSAECKAVSDICCTSANAVKVVNSLPNKRVIMIPDKNLGDYVQRFTKKEIISWPGFCPPHNRTTPADIKNLKEKYPGALFVAHPESTHDTIDVADHVSSTSGMYRYVRQTDAKYFIIGTEIGIMYKMRIENPDKIFIAANTSLVCPNMKKTHLDNTIDSLYNMKNIIKITEDIRLKARKSIENMLAL
ncbi:MAG: quinolinate synthase NadA [Candidatus Acididesulfobacter diazotrophicus]|jgi:quinolinate synthase|uniref:Quinolinate synthase n=1 Tax=Candidatus Acididesulfobacter diazotrophicus TaxID=2597226 RepID=A0A519BJR5_9DELT|nr:MAG: quinolinate synthase NadA [Candidatus Acididesulfobacter diazotrophicus]